MLAPLDLGRHRIYSGVITTHVSFLFRPHVEVAHPGDGLSLKPRKSSEACEQN